MFNVKDFGVKANSMINEAEKIDDVINECSENGGGIIYFPPGKYLSGTIHLKSNIIINLSPGATITMSSDDDDFDDLEDLPYNPHADAETTYFAPSLFRLDKVQNVSIIGGGTIDGNHTSRLGPKPIAVKQCNRVTIRDIKVINAPNYAMSFIDSEDITIDNSIIDNAYADGIDFDGCRYAKVLNCHVSSVDDAICLKSSPAMGKPIDCEHILILNSTFLTEYTAFKIGSETGPGNFYNIVMNNCTLGRKVGLTNHPGGITIDSYDGACISGLAFSNIAMRHIGTPININLAKRGRAQEIPTPGMISNILFNNIISLNAISGCKISGLLEKRIKNISFDNITIEFDKDARILTENPLKGCVFNCRHAEHVNVKNYHVNYPKDNKGIEFVAYLEDTHDYSIDLPLRT